MTLYSNNLSVAFTLPFQSILFLIQDFSNLKPIISPYTLDQLYTFHAQEREIFAKLILQFSRPPSESLLIIATWFWLETFGFENIFSIIFALPDLLILNFANEAVSCFRCLDSAEPPNGFKQIPLTAGFMNKNISLPIIYKHRYSAIVGIKTFLATVCSRIFSDILQQVIPYYSSSSSVNGFNHSLIIPGFPHQTFGNINVMTPSVVVGNNFSNNSYLFPNGLWKWNAHSISNEDDRTLFITFSRGYPVSQEEVKELFNQRYGENCVIGVCMGGDCINSPNTNGNSMDQQQSLFAKLVLDSVVTVDRILEGEKLQKFQINGKHIWARKYNEKKDGRT